MTVSYNLNLEISKMTIDNDVLAFKFLLNFLNTRFIFLYCQLHDGEYFGVKWFVGWSDVAGLPQELLETPQNMPRTMFDVLFTNRRAARRTHLGLLVSFSLVTLWSRQLLCWIAGGGDCRLVKLVKPQSGFLSAFWSALNSVHVIVFHLLVGVRGHHAAECWPTTATRVVASVGLSRL